VAVIDPRTNKTVATWPTAPATQPHGMALDTANHRIYTSGANGKLVSIDTGTGKVTGTAAIGEKVDQIAFDPSKQVVYCAGPDKMSMVSTSGTSMSPAGEFKTAATAKNVAFDPQTGAVWTTYTDGKSSFARSWVAAK
jgi:DNA-binding beta-propeller fold protein YncE